MRLNDLNKADLIWVINRMKMYCLGSHEYDRAMSDLQCEKEERNLREADKQAQIAHSERMKYCELLKPYDGVKIKDIPSDVLTKAGDALQRAQAADKKWLKLINIEN